MTDGPLRRDWGHSGDSFTVAIGPWDRGMALAVPYPYPTTPKQMVTNDSYPAVKATADSGSLRAETYSCRVIPQNSVSENRDRVVPKAL